MNQSLLMRRAFPPAAPPPLARRMNRRGACVTIAAALALQTLPAWSATPVQANPEGDGMSVRELMRLETRLALRQARQRAQAAEAHGAPTSATASSDLDLELQAIYGVGGKLLAQVRHNGRTLVYLRGSPLPVGVKDTVGNPVFRLVGLSGTCVELAREAVSHTLCLTGPGSAGR